MTVSAIEFTSHLSVPTECPCLRGDIRALLRATFILFGKGAGTCHLQGVLSFSKASQLECDHRISLRGYCDLHKWVQVVS